MSELPVDARHHEHHPFLQHHFEDLGQQHEASTLGMWFFLATEILFFGGILLAYTVYRVLYPHGWAVGAEHQTVLMGTINTIVLLGSDGKEALRFTEFVPPERLAAALAQVR